MSRLLLALACSPLCLPAAHGNGLTIDEIAPGVFVHQGVHEEASAANLGGIANIGFVVGDDAVAVIDSGGSAAQGRRLYDAIRRVTNRPVAYVINTHVHPDHHFGNAAFRGEGAVFVGHAKLPRALAARGRYYLDQLGNLLGAAGGESAVVLPDLTVAGASSLDLGGRVLDVAAHPTAHTDNDLTVFDRATGTLWTGDLLFIDRVPVIDGSLKGWLDATAALRRLDVRRVVPGHGPPSTDWPAVLDAQERYLRVLLEETRAAIASGATIEQALDTVAHSERPRWRLFDAYHTRNVLAAFTELEWE